MHTSLGVSMVLSRSISCTRPVRLTAGTRTFLTEARGSDANSCGCLHHFNILVSPTQSVFNTSNTENGVQEGVGEKRREPTQREGIIGG